MKKVRVILENLVATQRWQKEEVDYKVIYVKSEKGEKVLFIKGLIHFS